MAEQRTSQLPVEALTGATDARVSQVPLEALTGASKARVSQVPIEVLYIAPVAATTNPVLWKRGSVKTQIGTNVDKMSLTFWPDSSQLLNGLPWPEAVRKGALDGARIVVERAAMADWRDALDAPEADTAQDVGSTILFSGRVSHVQPSRNQIDVEVSSDFELLNVLMPRNIYQTGCIHTLFDSGCTLLKALFATSGVVTAGSTASVIAATALAQATGYFDLGTIRFTSGANQGVTRSVKTFLSGTSVEVAMPFPAIPAVGDTFLVYPGCDKTQATCNAKFSNLVHFLGFPFIPSPESVR